MRRNFPLRMKCFHCCPFHTQSLRDYAIVEIARCEIAVVNVDFDHHRNLCLVMVIINSIASRASRVMLTTFHAAVIEPKNHVNFASVNARFTD